MSTEAKTAYVAVTVRGTLLAQNLRRLMGTGEVYTTSKVKALLGEAELSPQQKTELSPQQKTEQQKTELSSKQDVEVLKEIEGSLGAFTRELFASYDYLIFIMAAGIVVRVIAPYVASKFKDPAVIVMDEGGTYAISFLSGHMGGANEMTHHISRLTGAVPVITTATDVNQKAALDCIIKDLNAYVEQMREVVKAVNYELAAGGEVGLYIAGNYKVDERGFVRLDQEFNLDEEEDSSAFIEKVKPFKYVVCISHERQPQIEALIPSAKLIKVIPRRFVLGVGCKKDTSSVHMQESFEKFMQFHGLEPYSIAKIASIDLKEDEEAIKALSSRLEVPFKVFTSKELSQVEYLFEGSAFVKKTTGVYCVAEPAAYLAGSGRVIISKEKYEGITFALAEA